MTAQFCPVIRDYCREELCVWWDAALDKCMVVAINDLMHSMYGGERADR